MSLLVHASARFGQSLHGLFGGWISWRRVTFAALFLAALSVSAHAPGAEGDAHGSHKTDFTSMLFVLLLATFVGLGVITRVSRLLHTPLMSLTNAISAIAVVGAIVICGAPNQPALITIMGAIALFASMTNIVSGFLITDRMLKMFKQPEQNKP